MNEFPRESRLKLFSYAVAALSKIDEVPIVKGKYGSTVINNRAHRRILRAAHIWPAAVVGA